MPTILPLDKSRADAQTAATLDAVKAKLGVLPNLFTTLAHAPVALKAYLQFTETLGGGRLTAKQREIVALATAQANGCQYCLSAHTLLGKGAGLSEQDIAQARQGRATDPLNAAIAEFTRKVVVSGGKLQPGDVAQARTSGLDDGLILEIVANVSLNVLTNYTNHIAETEVDFPLVAL